MAWTRAGQVGAELNTPAEWLLNGSTNAVVSNTKAFTGTYSVRHGASSHPTGLSFPAAVQVRASVYLNHNGTAGGSEIPYIFSWSGTDFVKWNEGSGLLQLGVDSSIVDTAPDTTQNFSNPNTWFALGIVIECNASTGWVSFYIDGVKALSATNVNTGTSINAIYFGGKAGTLDRWSNYAYFDNFYVDTSPGGEIDEAPTPKRFLWSIADANGSNSEWTGSDGDSVDNYQLVDDVPPDGDTTYVQTQAAANTDTYNTAAITVPAGFSIVAAIPTALTKRSGVTEQLQLVAYDGVNTTTGSAQDPSADYGVLSERMTTQPDGSNWNETDFNAMEVGYTSAGTF